MALTTLTTDLDYHQAQVDDPVDSGTLTTAQFKAMCDQAANDIKDFINDAHLPELDAAHLPYIYGNADTIEDTMAGVIAGVMPDGSVTPTKFSSTAYASEAEAEAGTENTKVMTPLRVAQALSALLPIEVGSYTGTGTYGVGNENSITSLSFTPRFMIILVAGGVSSEDAGVENPVFINPSTSYAGMKFNPSQNVGENISTGYVSWGTDSITWYSSSGAARQCNTSGHTYYYFIIG